MWKPANLKEALWSGTDVKLETEDVKVVHCDVVSQMHDENDMGLCLLPAVPLLNCRPREQVIAESFSK